jgi:di/tricarboxylate transporter
VLARTSALIGTRFADAPVDARRDMRLLAISHAGDRVQHALEQHVFAPGDTLLVEADGDFAERHRHDRDFLVVSPLADSTAPAFRRAPLALAILAALIANAIFAVLPLFESVAIAAALMIATRCVTTRVATQSIDYPTIVSIAASFALGAALTQSGAAKYLSDWVSMFSHGDAFLALVFIYVATVLVTEVITNNAAGVVMFPIAISVAAVTGSDPRPFVIAVMVGASAGFVTPIGYQTNMMVYGPGGYRFMDFVRYGLPLSILTGIVTLTIVPRVWPF